MQLISPTVNAIQKLTDADLFAVKDAWSSVSRDEKYLDARTTIAAAAGGIEAAFNDPELLRLEQAARDAADAKQSSHPCRYALESAVRWGYLAEKWRAALNEDAYHALTIGWRATGSVT